MKQKFNSPLIVILGPTATGKTNLAVQIAKRYSAEIISGDSRQVYKGMDIGTGKDIEEYTIDGQTIPYHLIDIISPTQDYSVFQFQKDFYKCYKEIRSRKSIPILCGGTGLYLESILLNYNMAEVNPNPKLRKKLEKESHEELIQKLKELNPKLHNTTNLSSKKRTIRAIEIGLFEEKGTGKREKDVHFNYCVIGIVPERKIVRDRITNRLKVRLKSGLIDEVENLLKNGLNRDRLDYFGLEYKFIGQFLDGSINYNDMFQKLNTAIHQLSKRQMTFFRRMEKRGIQINWVEKNEFEGVSEILTKYFQE